MAEAEMKFKTDTDAQMFLAEIKCFAKISEANKDYIPTREELQTFIKGRKDRVNDRKDYRKGKNQKQNWRKNRSKMMKGIKAYHKSTKGKRFHKKLGNYLATRLTKKDEVNSYTMLQNKRHHLAGLNSAKQHLLVELNYYHPIDEQIEVEEIIIDYSIPLLMGIESAIINETELTDDQLTFLFDIVEESAILQYVSKKSGKEFALIEKVWNAIQKDLVDKKNIAKDSEDFYPTLVTEFKTKLFKEKKKNVQKKN